MGEDDRMAARSTIGGGTGGAIIDGLPAGLLPGNGGRPGNGGLPPGRLTSIVSVFSKRTEVALGRDTSTFCRRMVTSELGWNPVPIGGESTGACDACGAFGYSLLTTTLSVITGDT